MAEILDMPLQPRQKGRRRERPIKGAPMALIIDGVDFRKAIGPTPEEVKQANDQLALHLLQTVRAAQELQKIQRRMERAAAGEIKHV
ncbi:hypothetical protein QYH69_15795 [Paraburkholderia sp. SARCC-3016]|uniref:hypothetical protein n=1 Tax=Paraburkholderia sp. SARCC-3016 TaxID=3058611 RepID=UPI0028092965|nr:hypothetical protein [Paraburkholderia sp. SARCC-3016]MDQ7978714.1 hypothetical protein [Paraburkholderia sp. SARCC-3016]